MSERYEIKGKIARGGIGAIYRAYDKVMGIDVAIKRLLPIEETHLNESADESLQREATALSSFQHPNIITIYAFEKDEEGHYVVMELVEGETLKETVSRAALPVDDFAELTLQILDPLIAARDLNLLHRDIKPSNIMMSWLASGRFQIKVLDFGLAKFSQKPSTQTLDQTGSFLGSIDYLAPEQLDLQKLDQRTDLYSLGCVLYYCLTQTPPFEGENAAKTMQNHLSHRVTALEELRPDVPPPICRWVMRMIARYPNQRPEDARAALKEFREALEEEVEDEVPMAILASESPGQVNPAVEGSQDSPGEPISGKRRLVTGSAPQRKPQPNLLVPTSDSAPVNRKVSRGTAAQRKAGVEMTQKSQVKAPGMAGVPETGGARFQKIFILVAITVVALVIGGFIWSRLNADAGSDAVGPESEGTVPRLKSTKNSSGGASEKNGSPGPVKKRPPSASNPEANAPMVAPKLPITVGLVGHYSASDYTFGRNLRNPAKQGEKVFAWANLAPERRSDHLLSYQRGKESATPTLFLALAADFPELNGDHSMLSFSEGTTLEAKGAEQIEALLSGQEFTFFLVMRSSVDQAPVFRVKSPSVNPAAAITVVPKGFGGMMRQGTQWKTASVKAPKSQFVITSMTWKADEGAHRFFLRLPDGKALVSPPLKTTVKDLRIDGYRIGHLPPPPKAEKSARIFSGHVAELVLYGKALSETDRKEVEEHLYQRYFAK